MATLHVELLLPDRSLWSGEAGMVIAKTMDGDIGVLPGHAPVFGILSPGSLVRIRDVDGTESPGDAVRAAVRDGFLSVSDDRVSIPSARRTEPTTPREDQSLFLTRALAIGDRPSFRVAEKRASDAGIRVSITTFHDEGRDQFFE